MNKLHSHECDDCGLKTDDPCPNWAKQRFDIENLTNADFGAKYTDVFERLFRFAQLGYACLRQEMHGAYPSYGYIVLSQILAETDHQLVITTNFDNLAALSVSLFTNAVPLTIVHEALASYAAGRINRPTIAKLHRDLLFDPLNRTSDLRQLPENWKERLDQWFSDYMPIFIGYGGNDWTLMRYLENVPPVRFRNGLVWCQHRGSTLSDRVQEVVRRLRGLVVEIDGFDEFMQALYPKLGLEKKIRANLKQAEQRLMDSTKGMMNIISGAVVEKEAVTELDQEIEVRAETGSSPKRNARKGEKK